VRQIWGPSVHNQQVRKFVDLPDSPDSPDVTWLRKPKKGREHPVTGRLVSITFEFSRYGGGPWIGRHTLYAERPGSIIRDFFGPDRVIDMPPWLTDLVDGAMPTT